MEMEIIKKLDILLNHWMEHNREHAAEYEKWALKAKEEGLTDISQAIQTAGEVIQKSNDNLLNALNLLKKHTQGNE
ncbi:MAG: hypothetical protein JRJ08_04470 [Deltaproteobacteria bacterium]|nr:hypothetical protein [Deltaproteobacteria bacterium]